MEKTKLGVSTALVAVLLFVLAYFSGYLAVIVLAGYILLQEESVWLKRTAVKALIIMAFFSVLTLAINYLPDFLYDLTYGADYESFFYKLHNGINKYTNIQGQLLNALEIVVYVIMVIGAFRHKTIRLPLIDKILDKHFEA